MDTTVFTRVFYPCHPTACRPLCAVPSRQEGPNTNTPTVRGRNGACHHAFEPDSSHPGRPRPPFSCCATSTCPNCNRKVCGAASRSIIGPTTSPMISIVQSHLPDMAGAGAQGPTRSHGVLGGPKSSRAVSETTRALPQGRGTPCCTASRSEPLRRGKKEDQQRAAASQRLSERCGSVLRRLDGRCDPCARRARSFALVCLASPGSFSSGSRPQARSRPGDGRCGGGCLCEAVWETCLAGRGAWLARTGQWTVCAAIPAPLQAWGRPPAAHHRAGRQLFGCRPW